MKSADRVMAVMEVLGSRQERPTLTQLSAELGIPLSSLHGLLRTMQQRGWVETDDTGSLYRIGVRALMIGSSYARADEAVLAARPVLDWLSEETGETVHYGRLLGSEIIYLAKRESRFLVRVHSSVGQRIPAHAASLGKAILATENDDWVVDRLRWPLVALAPNTITDREALLQDLAAVRDRGYASECQESDIGLSCVAVSIPGPGSVRDAISLAVPVGRLEGDRLAELANLLLEARAMLSGGRAPAPPGRSAEFLGNLNRLEGP
ncbi:IclR family transcriptional regulator [Streptomyces sp. NBC_01361]|uniref:IclR family transcriptional regulator n=1 Tax=Streptomyces sp. NBC_01361 TaxID=2903838 RepID=UPI002E31AA01|nr:IclR family transcriptional regulator [Streptomyces sp. NBC_01361]